MRHLINITLWLHAVQDVTDVQIDLRQTAKWRKNGKTSHTLWATVIYFVRVRVELLRVVWLARLVRG